MQIITSGSNEKVKRLRRLYTKKGRDEEKSFLAEGERVISEIPEDYPIDCFYVSESYYKIRQNPVLKRAENIVLMDGVFQAAAGTVAPQGIIAALRQKEYNIMDVISQNRPLFALCDKMQDPGNLGSVIRSGDAFSANAVIISPDSVELYNPKVVRASAGSIFHLPVIHFDILQICGILKNRGVKIAAACLTGGVYPEDIDLSQSIAMLTGNEGNGLSNELIQMADYRVKIPMTGRSESLNASVSSGVLLYEAQRQRQKYK